MIRARDGWALAVVALALLLAAAYASIHKGAWFDEYFSIHAAMHRAPLGRLFPIWLTDAHPPLAHFMNWLFEPLVGDDIQARRSLNFIPLIGAMWAILILARGGAATAAFATVFGLLMLASPFTLEQLIEHRANFAQLAAMAVIVMTLARIEFADRDFAGAEWTTVVIMAAAIGFAFNLHYVGALSAGIVLTLSIVRQWLARRPRWALVEFTICAVFALPLLAAFAAQQAALGSAVREIWIASSSADAVKTIADLAMTTAKSNLVVSVAATLGLLGMLRKQRTPVPANLRLAATLAVAAMTVFAVLLAFNTMRPIVVMRYLVSEVPLLAGVLAALAAPVMAGSRNWLIAATVAAIGTLGLSAWRLSTTLHWDANARAIAQVVASCPSTAVHTPRRWQMVAVGSGTENFATFNTGFAALARRYDFKVAPEDSRRVDDRCPTIIWAEHYHLLPPSPRSASEGLPICTASIDGATVTRSASGFFIRYPACR